MLIYYLKFAVLDAAVWCIAVVHTAALADLLVILVLTGLDDKLDVYDLCRANLPKPNAQRTAAALAVVWLMLYYPVWCSDRLQGASLVARLTATRLSAGFAQRLRPSQLTCRNTFLRWWDAAVATVLFWFP